MTRQVDLILPDAGPIISLAHADRLDLLDLFAVPVIVLDVVKGECLRKPASPDHSVLAAWFGRSGGRVSVAPTPLGPLYEQAVERERRGEDVNATRGLGDAALSWALRNIEQLARPGSLPVVLIEDRRLAVRLQGLNKGHILSTRTWLASLEEAGLADFAAVVAAMARRRRALSGLAADLPAGHGDDESEWLSALTDRK